MTPEYIKQLQVLTERALAESLARSRLQAEANAARIRREIATLTGHMLSGSGGYRKYQRRLRALARLEASL